MADERALLRFSQDAEEVATGLRAFRDILPDRATSITAVLSELFQVSRAIREILSAHSSQRYAANYLAIQDDMSIVFATLQHTLDASFDLFSSVRGRVQSHAAAWTELTHAMAVVEGMDFLERLELYLDFLHAQRDVVTGQGTPRTLVEMRRRLIALIEVQEVSSRDRAHRRLSTSSTPTPGRPPPRPRPARLITPSAPTIISDEWSEFEHADMSPPLAPEAPPFFGPGPTSPTFTSSSSRTLDSSNTSYSNGPTGAHTTEWVHWTQDVYSIEHPGTAFKPEHQLTDRSACYGQPDPRALHHLVEDGFHRVLELSFNEQSFWLRLYWRPTDDRARITVITQDSHGQPQIRCTTLTNLRIIREDSTLQLCRINSSGTYVLWTRLNFQLYERMVLFYSTFIVMKNQDTRGLPHGSLADDAELLTPSGEKLEFAGKIVHPATHQRKPLQHALRLYRDRGSGVFRLEASALRGRMRNVPLWTAFVTRYAHDPDWAELQAGGCVGLAALRPAPFVFLKGFEVPRSRGGEFLLRFADVDDARCFVETWTGICRGNT